MNAAAKDATSTCTATEVVAAGGGVSGADGGGGGSSGNAIFSVSNTLAGDAGAAFADTWCCGRCKVSMPALSSLTASNCHT